MFHSGSSFYASRSTSKTSTGLHSTSKHTLNRKGTGLHDFRRRRFPGSTTTPPSGGIRIAGPPSAASRTTREPPPSLPSRHVGRKPRPRGARAEARPPMSKRPACPATPRQPGDPVSTKATRAFGNRPTGGAEGVGAMKDGTDMITFVINAPASGAMSASGRNRTAACTTAPVGSRTCPGGRNPRGPLRTFLSVSQGLTASHDGSVQAPASRKELRRERGACRERDRRRRGSGEI